MHARLVRGKVRVGEEVLAGPNVGVGMVVVPDPGLGPRVVERVVGIDERVRRQLPRLAVGEEPRVRVRDRVVLLVLVQVLPVLGQIEVDFCESLVTVVVGGGRDEVSPASRPLQSQTWALIT